MSKQSEGERRRSFEGNAPVSSSSFRLRFFPEVFGVSAASFCLPRRFGEDMSAPLDLTTTTSVILHGFFFSSNFTCCA